MQSIGTIQFISLTGRVASFGKQLESVSRPGRDGSIFRFLGNRAKEFQLVGKTTYATRENATIGRLDLKAIKGTFVPVEYNGDYFTNVCVKDVDISDLRHTLIATDGSFYRYETVFTLQLTADQ